MDVVEWINAPPVVVSRARARDYFCSPMIAGLTGSLLLHAIALHSLHFGGRPQKRELPEIQAAGLSNHASKAAAAETLVFVDLTKEVTNTNDMKDALGSVRTAARAIRIVMSRPESLRLADVQTLVIDEKEPVETAIGDAEDAEHARLRGIYSGQIRARIERIWRRPRSPVSDDPARAEETFSCQVQIVQDDAGNVNEVLLPNCNGSVAWRRSLVLAIQQASPLPAPPSTTVFTHSIAMEFAAIPYRPGDPEEEYEILAQGPRG